MDANAEFENFLASLKPEISKKLTDEGYADFPTLQTLIAWEGEFEKLFRSADRVRIMDALKKLDPVAAGTIPTRFPKKIAYQFFSDFLAYELF